MEEQKIEPLPDVIRNCSDSRKAYTIYLTYGDEVKPILVIQGGTGEAILDVNPKLVNKNLKDRGITVGDLLIFVILISITSTLIKNFNKDEQTSLMAIKQDLIFYNID